MPNQDDDEVTRVSKKSKVNVIRISEYIREVVGKSVYNTFIFK